MSDTPAPIASPEENRADLGIGEAIAAKFTADLGCAEAIAEAIAAERSTSAAEIERLTRVLTEVLQRERNASHSDLDVQYEAEALRRDNVTLTAEVGRMREALEKIDEDAAIDEDTIVVGSAELSAFIRAALSPEPEAKET